MYTTVFEENNMESISIIIPVYNAEKYLSGCLDSLLNQTYPHLHIILVNDGSTDASPHICDAYAQKHPHIQVIHQQNQGVSMARNTGIANATGEYLAFIDADDYVAVDYFEHLYNKIKEQAADMICCNYQEMVNGSAVSCGAPKVAAPRKITDSHQFYEDIVRCHETYWSCVWGKLIKTELARKAIFPSGVRYGEDQIYMYDLFRLEPTVYLDTYVGYYYVRNESGAMGSRNEYNMARCLDELSVHEYKLDNLPSAAADLTDEYGNLCAIGVHLLARAVVLSKDVGQRKKYRSFLCHKINMLSKRYRLGSDTRLYLALYRYTPVLYRLLIHIKYLKRM